MDFAVPVQMKARLRKLRATTVDSRDVLCGHINCRGLLGVIRLEPPAVMEIHAAMAPGNADEVVVVCPVCKRRQRIYPKTLLAEAREQVAGHVA